MSLRAQNPKQSKLSSSWRSLLPPPVPINQSSTWRSLLPSQFQSITNQSIIHLTILDASTSCNQSINHQWSTWRSLLPPPVAINQSIINHQPGILCCLPQLQSINQSSIINLAFFVASSPSSTASPVSNHSHSVPVVGHLAGRLSKTLQSIGIKLHKGSNFFNWNKLLDLNSYGRCVP